MDGEQKLIDLGDKRKLIDLDGIHAKGIRYDRTSLWRMEREKRFPQRVKLGARAVAWVESEIDQWVAERINARSAGGAK
jgi:prophage regulatory protein